MRGLLKNLIERRSDADMQGLITGSSSLFGTDTNTGVSVNTQNAERITAVMASVRILAETVASLPLVLYKRERTGKFRAIDHPLYNVLHTQANPEMSSWNLREALVRNQVLTGNGYCEIESNEAGQITALWPLISETTSIWRDAARNLWYVVELPTSVGGGFAKLPAERVFHLRMFSRNGLTGRSVITMAREALGLAIATEESGARFFKNGSQIGVVLEHPGKLDEPTANRIAQSWAQAHEGLTNSHRAAVLEEGMKVEKIGVSPEEAQFLESRKFQVSEIARMFRIPPHMIGDLEKATFSNIEQQSTEFVVYSLMPWLSNFEQAINTQLLTAPERKIYFSKFLVDGLLRGDILSRYQAYGYARQNGWLSANDIREKEDMNPVTGGDAYLVPLNMVPSDQVGSARGLDPLALPPQMTIPLSSPEQRGNQNDLVEYRNGIMVRAATLRSIRSRKRLMTAYRKLYEDTAKRLVKRETQDLIALAKKDFKTRGFSSFSTDLEGYYRDEFIPAAKRMMLPVVMAYGDLVASEAADEINVSKPQERLDGFLTKYADTYAQRHATHSQNKLQTVLKGLETNGEDPIIGLEGEFEGWNENRPGEIAFDESVRSNNAVAHLVYMIGGILVTRWFSSGGGCSYCSSLDGMTVGIEEVFLRGGEDYKPEGAEAPLNPSSDIGHPPAHNGCECMIGAG